MTQTMSDLLDALARATTKAEVIDRQEQSPSSARLVASVRTALADAEVHAERTRGAVD